MYIVGRKNRCFGAVKEAFLYHFGKSRLKLNLEKPILNKVLKKDALGVKKRMYEPI